MLGSVVGFVVLTVVLGGSGARVVYRWDKTKIVPQMGTNNWRATSFAIAKDKIFLTLVDIEKEESGNGVVGAFNMSASASPDVSIFPFQNFYKMSDPLRGKITTPMTVRTDDCDRLWLLDSAVQNIGGIQLKTNPAIYIFNTNTSQLIRSFNIPTTQWTSASFFVNFVVGTDNTDHDCEESHGYFADFNRFHLLTYDFLRNKSELKSHPFFSPDPLVHIPDHVLFNPRHQDLNGLFGLALADHRSPHLPDTLYFHPLAGTHEFAITTTLLKSQRDLNYRDVHIVKDKGQSTESGVSVFDRQTDTIFFAEVNTNKIGAFGFKDPKHSRPTTYYNYDFKLDSGHIVDLNVRHSELWLLVDDSSAVTIYNLPIAEINEGLHRSTPPHPAPSSAAGHLGLPDLFLHLLPLLPFYLLL